MKATAAYARDEVDLAKRKITTWSDFSRLGESVTVLTKGSFDILHSGHISLMTYCDRLRKGAGGGAVVVVVESDHSVRARKGDKRPIQDESHRSLQLALLPTVQRVIVASSADLGLILEATAPRYYVKGGDTAVGNTVLGEPEKLFLDKTRNMELEYLGPRTEVVVFLDDGRISTSSLLAKIHATDG
ncbi:hypothetical protein [Candidatus Accumulibacter cognatus]|uniref:Bifunctional protein HldE n=1 Tax=Candidatus Accumulibacter cognatus TaxID=2954383 RepID=A0A080M782_9PROT|nr:hypothetical protein [Candidatus Accumulibacter cognatus]KFB76846.1 MAG: Bifunctional protein HldE [Candidatus Accumulibacter cognatus]